MSETEDDVRRAKMTYCCDGCGFLFFRTGEIGRCPSCEGYRIRPATAEEAERLKHLLREKR